MSVACGAVILVGVPLTLKNETSIVVRYNEKTDQPYDKSITRYFRVIENTAIEVDIHKPRGLEIIYCDNEEEETGWYLGLVFSGTADITECITENRLDLDILKEVIDTVTKRLNNNYGYPHDAGIYLISRIFY